MHFFLVFKITLTHFWKWISLTGFNFILFKLLTANCSLLFAHIFSFILYCFFALPHVSESDARRCYVLGLKLCLDDVQRIRYDSSHATCYTGTNEVPEVRILFFPRFYQSFQIFVYANNHGWERYIHENCDWIWTIETLNPFFFYHLF